MNKSLVQIIVFCGLVMAAVLTFAASITALSYRESQQENTLRSFSVTGEATKIAVPDIAEFRFGVITQGGKDVSSLRRENDQKMNGAISFLKGLDIAEKDIATQQYNIEPCQQYFSCPEGGGACKPPEIVGYTVTQNVLVKIRNFSNIGDALAGVQEKGANSV